MHLSQSLLAELDRELPATRKTLERIPEDKVAWKPHDKSMTLGRLAGHVAELLGFGAMILQSEFMDLDQRRSSGSKPTVAETREQIVSVFDKNAADLRAAIANTSDDEFSKKWSLIYKGKTLFAGPKSAALRAMSLSHMVHHRAQLGVYLRLNNVAVPSIYGPSADEGYM